MVNVIINCATTPVNVMVLLRWDKLPPETDNTPVENVDVNAVVGNAIPVVNVIDAHANPPVLALYVNGPVVSSIYNC